MRNLLTKRVGIYWQSESIEIRNSAIHGQGIFSNRSINEGEIIMKWEGELFTAEEIRQGKAKPNSICGYNEGVYLGQPINENDTIDQYLNHSCDPNTWMNSELIISARKNILPDCELTADYAIWEIDPDWELPVLCNCRSEYCREKITGKDWMQPYLQEKYRNHFLPCINKRIHQHSFANKFAK